MKILVTGLTGSGKTTLANELAPLINATVFDGDTIRMSYPNPLGFSLHDRALHAYHMGTLCEAVTASGNNAIAAFVCPTDHTRSCFNPDFTILCDDAGDQKYPDTVGMWRAPANPDLIVTKDNSPRYWAEVAASLIQPVFNPMAPTALFVGRFQPFHGGHKSIIVEGIKRYGQACIGVRDHNRDWPFHRVRQRIEHGLRMYQGRFTVVPLPNIAAVCYGRDVGYEIKQIDAPQEIEEISATKIRQEIGS